MADKGFAYFWKKLKQAPFRGEIGGAMDEMARRTELRDFIHATIEQEGGNAVAVKEMGMILGSPFKGYARFGAVYFEATCRYENDGGSWYICIYDATDHRWLWKSMSRSVRMPRPRANGDLVEALWQIPYWISQVLLLAVASLIVWLMWPWLGP
ncbi:hypothetical protein GC173_07050 [bacterium]|nr:hypothetical protein [bacterium]